MKFPIFGNKVSTLQRSPRDIVLVIVIIDGPVRRHWYRQRQSKNDFDNALYILRLSISFV